jgi:hypothetical protein
MLADPFLASLINADGLVTIGSYIFNIDLVNGKGYALHTNWLNGSDAAYYYNLIYNGTTGNEFIFEFAADDEAIEMLEDWGLPLTKKQIPVTTQRRCGEGGALRQKRDGKETLNNTYDPKTPNDWVDCKAVYQKAIIYFSLVAKIKFHHPIGHISPFGDGWQACRAYFAWRFKPKCWSDRIQAPAYRDARVGPPNYTEADVMTDRPWSSTRGLSKYDMAFYWVVKGHILSSNYSYQTNVYAIKAGY